MDISKEIKKLLVDADITLTELARNFSLAKNNHYTVQNLSQNHNKGTVNAQEINIILETLGYNVYFFPKNK